MLLIVYLPESFCGLELVRVSRMKRQS